jgi:LAO/AO transport system kinase
MTITLPKPLETLFQDFRAGKRQALARAITLVENEYPGSELFLEALFPLIGKAHRIGITGPPGSGKSSLLARLISAFRQDHAKVALLCIDPSSPFHGGAFLGDRYRLIQHSADPEVYIRSVATRGTLGGISSSALAICDLFDAFGFNPILIETVGVGQSEVDIAEICDTTLVNLSPESGDAIQGMKSGLMEIAQLIFINKADRPEASKLLYELQSALEFSQKNIPVLSGSALQDQGISALKEALQSHHSQLKSSHAWKELQERRILKQLEKRLRQQLWHDVQPLLPEMKQLAQELVANRHAYLEKTRTFFQKIKLQCHP